MSKTFKSVTDNESELDVRANDCGVFIAFSRAGQIWQASTFAPSDAPSLALAILEAAGHKIAQRGDMDTVQIHVGAAIYELGCAREAQERASAEAKEQAELEAEALELRNAYMNQIGRTNVAWDDMSEEQQEIWLAVARKARELGGRAE